MTVRPSRRFDAASWRTYADSPDEAVGAVRSGTRAFLHGASATPTSLIEALCARPDLEGVEVCHLHTAGPAPFTVPGVEKRVRSVSFFAAGPVPPLPFVLTVLHHKQSPPALKA